MALSSDILDAAKKAAAGIQEDVFFYNGPMASPADLHFVESVFKAKKHDRATLFLTTNGGDPDAAYKKSRYLQDKYSYLTVVIAGRCKSAGTLLAIGANELAFMPYGELGPLDIQLAKVDRFDQLQSGLAIQDALNTLEKRAVQKFHSVTTDWIKANHGLISFAVASKAAGDFVAQLYGPILSRIDPEEVGARTRYMRIATDYGKRLSVKSQNLKPDTLRILAETYSSHSFVIDQQEAATLFERVRPANAAEKAVVEALGKNARFETQSASDGVCHALHDFSSAARQGIDNDKTHRARGAPKNGGNSQRAVGPSRAPTASGKGRGRGAGATNGKRPPA
jgi:hypothetical protein